MPVTTAATGDDIDLQGLASWHALTPCGPLYQTHVSPDSALRAVAAEHMPPDPPVGRFHRCRARRTLTLGVWPGVSGAGVSTRR